MNILIFSLTYNTSIVICCQWVHAREASNKVICESVNGFLGGVDEVVIRWNKLEGDLLLFGDF